MSDSLGPPANPNARCVMPSDDDPKYLCGKPATHQRLIEGIIAPVCSEHYEDNEEEEST